MRRSGQSHTILPDIHELRDPVWTGAAPEQKDDAMLTKPLWYPLLVTAAPPLSVAQEVPVPEYQRLTSRPIQLHWMITPQGLRMRWVTNECAGDEQPQPRVATPAITPG
jgi:hypothetical protein